MATYQSMHGMDNPIEAFGLSGYYIFAAIGIFALCFLLLLFFSGTTVLSFVIQGCIIAIGFGIIALLVFLNKRYGIHGIMKFMASRELPDFIKNNSPIEKLILRK